MTSAIVVGGGIAGMTAASRLLDVGYEVTLIESSPTIGGLASPWTIAFPCHPERSAEREVEGQAGASNIELTWDRFYHVILESDARTRAMLREIGLENEIVWNTVRSGLYADGALRSFSSGWDLLRFPGLSPSDKLRFGLTILHAAKAQEQEGESDPYDRVSAIDYLTERSGKRVTEKWWRPLLRAKLGDEYEEASAAFIRTTIKRLYGARKNETGVERFGYVPGGYKRILERYEMLLRSRGVRILTNTQVRKVSEHDNGVVIETSEDEITASCAIVTTPSSIAMQIIPQIDPDLRSALLSDRYMGVICLSVVTKKPLGPYYVTNIADPSVPFTGIINMSALVTDESIREESFGGKALSYVPKYVAANDPLFKENDDAIVASFMPHLYRVYPALSPGDVLAVRVARAQYVFPYPDQGRSERVNRMDPARYADRRIAIVNAARLMHAVLNVNDTIGIIENGISALQLEKKGLHEPARRAIA